MRLSPGKERPGVRRASSVWALQPPGAGGWQRQDARLSRVFLFVRLLYPALKTLRASQSLFFEPPLITRRGFRDISLRRVF